MDKSELFKYALELEKKNALLRRAFELSCKCLREHPPIDTCDHFELVQCVVNAKEDPEGKRWMAKFLLEAEAELKGDNHASESYN